MRVTTDLPSARPGCARPGPWLRSSCAASSSRSFGSCGPGSTVRCGSRDSTTRSCRARPGTMRSSCDVARRRSAQRRARIAMSACLCGVLPGCVPDYVDEDTAAIAGDAQAGAPSSCGPSAAADVQAPEVAAPLLEAGQEPEVAAPLLEGGDVPSPPWSVEGGDAPASPPPGPVSAACDVSGRWLVAQRVVAQALGQQQAGHGWFYYELSQSGGHVLVTKGLQCGFGVTALTPLGANVDSHLVWASLLAH